MPQRWSEVNSNTGRVESPYWSHTPSQVKEAKPFMYKGIAISGKIASGKTTLARVLELEYKIPILPLAALLKDDVCESLYARGLALDPINILLDHKADLRGTLQEWGAIFRKVNGPDYWIDKLFRYAKNQGHSHFICDDMRFPNELEVMKAHGFLTIRLNIGGPKQELRLQDLYPDTPMSQLQHASETALDGYDSQFDIVVPASTVRLEQTIPFVRKRMQNLSLAFA